MSTPPPRNQPNGKRKIKMSAEMKQGLIDNFDLEVANRLEMLTSIHLSSLSSFLTRQETAIQRIPLEMRRMTVKEIGDRWSGGIRGVMDGLTRGRLEVEEQGRDQQDEAVAATKEGGKRKRPTTASQLSMPTEKDNRLPKSARKNPFTDATQTQATPGPSRKKKNASPTRPSSTSAASAPFASSAFKFNPHLPSTPLLTNANGYRRPRRNESIAMSTNGSPLIIGGAEDEDEDEDAAEGRGSAGGSDEEDLLDEEEEMRRLESKTNGAQAGSSSGRKGKGKARPSSIQLLPSSSQPTTTSTSKPTAPPTFAASSPSALNLLIPIPLPNGQTLSFNALSDSPTKLDDFLRAEGGVSDEERGRIRGQIDRSVRMLGERLGKWKIGGS